MVELLRKTLEENKDKYLKNLRDLLVLDTRLLGHGFDGGFEKRGQEYLQRLLSDMGAEVETEQVTEETILKAIEQYSEGNPGHNNDDRYNVYGTFEAGKGGRSIMFNGHMDVMPPGNEEEWTYPPFSAEVSDGTVYARGVVDMKGGLMAAIMAVQLLKDAGIPIPGEVQISSTVDEEGGGNGSLQAVMSGHKADGVVVCEASDGNVIVANRGFYFIRVQVAGKAVRSADKWAGVSAIEKAIKLIEALGKLEKEWSTRYTHPLLDPPVINIGTIHGGDAGSVVSDKCTFELCGYFLPGSMDYNGTLAQIRKAMDDVAQEDEWLRDHPPVMEIYQSGLAFETRSDHPFVMAAQDAFEKVTGTAAPIAGDPSGCDARFWYNIAGCPTIHFGPGESFRCHSVDEQMKVQEYLDYIAIYAQLILNWFQ